MKKLKIGVVGCGNIHGIYFDNLTGKFEDAEIVACTDLIKEKAEEAAKKYNVRHVLTTDELIRDPEIDIILNITNPKSHFEVTKEALENGKHVYSEKPLALSFEEGLELVNLAKEKKLQLGGAPDTFMGAGIQTCCKLIDDGYIGTPLGATAFMMCRGHETWHPDPEFYYENGGGPMLDMGPYYITALVNLLGSVSEVCGMSIKGFDKRIITSQPKYGKVFDVEVNTHVTGLLRFEKGATATLITSFDTVNSTLPFIEIYGTKGTLIVPDPNYFGSEIKLATQYDNNFKSIPFTHIYSENSRGIGLAQMSKVIKNGGVTMASCQLTCHALEVMCAINTSDTEKTYYKMTTRYDAQRMSTDLITGIV